MSSQSNPSQSSLTVSQWSRLGATATKTFLTELGKNLALSWSDLGDADDPPLPADGDESDAAAEESNGNDSITITNTPLDTQQLSAYPVGG